MEITRGKERDCLKVNAGLPAQKLNQEARHLASPEYYNGLDSNAVRSIQFTM
jgi:hypothetical protein